MELHHKSKVPLRSLQGLICSWWLHGCRGCWLRERRFKNFLEEMIASAKRTFSTAFTADSSHDITRTPFVCRSPYNVGDRQLKTYVTSSLCAHRRITLSYRKRISCFLLRWAQNSTLSSGRSSRLMATTGESGHPTSTGSRNPGGWFWIAETWDTHNILN